MLVTTSTATLPTQITAGLLLHADDYSVLIGFQYVSGFLSTAYGVRWLLQHLTVCILLWLISKTLACWPLVSLFGWLHVTGFLDQDLVPPIYLPRHSHHYLYLAFYTTVLSVQRPLVVDSSKVGCKPSSSCRLRQSENTCGRVYGLLDKK